jgi:hypothetical protein
MAVIQNHFGCIPNWQHFIRIAAYVVLFCGYVPICAQENLPPTAFPPQEVHSPQPVQTKALNSLGFGIWFSAGDASAGREVLMLATRYSRRISSFLEAEIALQYQSTSVALSNSFNFRFTSVAWNSDVSLLALPFQSLQNLRAGIGVSVQRQVGNYTVTQTSVSSMGLMQTVRLTEYQQALSMGASCMIDYSIFTTKQIEVSLRGRAYIYGMPISGEINQIPRGTPGGGLSLDVFIRAFF